jgi:hypothetical protein
VIRHCLVVALLFSGFVQFGYAQEPSPLISAVQQGNKTIFLLSGNWTAAATNAEFSLSSTAPVLDAVSSRWWNATVESENAAKFTFATPNNATSIFAVFSNASDPKFDYVLSIDSSEYSGTIKPLDNSYSESFVNWTDGREGAMSAFIPEGWQADLQIVRPYKSMTGFVFFVRGEENSLGYVFYPYMPLHIVPDKDVCKALTRCDGVVSTEIVQESSFGNAPVVVSGVKAPLDYFQSEILPQLRENLDGYEVRSVSPLFALEYDEANRPGSEFLEGLEVNYGFDASGKKITGRAGVFITNSTSVDSGFWNGVVIGVESSTESFEQDFSRVAVTLLTLRLSDAWVSEEQAVLDNGAASVTPGLRNVSSIVANATLADFGSVINTVAHALVRSQENMAIAPYSNIVTGEEMHLPEHEAIQNWYLSEEKLAGKKIGRNVMNATTIVPLYR